MLCDCHGFSRMRSSALRRWRFGRPPSRSSGRTYSSRGDGRIGDTRLPADGDANARRRCGVAHGLPPLDDRPVLSAVLRSLGIAQLPGPGTHDGPVKAASPACRGRSEAESLDGTASCPTIGDAMPRRVAWAVPRERLSGKRSRGGMCPRDASQGQLDRGEEAAGGAIEAEPSVLPGHALTEARQSLHLARDRTGAVSWRLARSYASEACLCEGSIRRTTASITDSRLAPISFEVAPRSIERSRAEAAAWRARRCRTVHQVGVWPIRDGRRTRRQR